MKTALTAFFVIVVGIPAFCALILLWVFWPYIKGSVRPRQEQGQKLSRTLYRECPACRYYYGDPRLPCAVNPTGGGERCPDFEKWSEHEMV